MKLNYCQAQAHRQDNEIQSDPLFTYIQWVESCQTKAVTFLKMPDTF